MMRKKSLIHTRNTRTWTGEQLHLEYYLLSEPILGGCADSYGVEVLARNGNEVEYAGVPVQMVKGSYDNIKITTPEDLAAAAAFLAYQKERGESE